MMHSLYIRVGSKKLQAWIISEGGKNDRPTGNSKRQSMQGANNLIDCILTRKITGLEE